MSEKFDFSKINLPTREQLRDTAPSRILATEGHGTIEGRWLPAEPAIELWVSEELAEQILATQPPLALTLGVGENGKGRFVPLQIDWMI